MASTTPIFIRVKDAAERYAISTATIQRALRNGELTRIKRGRATLLDIQEADAWARGESAPSTAAE